MSGIETELVNSLLAGNLEDDNLALDEGEVEDSLLALASGQGAEDRGLLEVVLVVRVVLHVLVVVLLVIVLALLLLRVLRLLVVVVALGALERLVVLVRVELGVLLEGRLRDGVVGDLDNRAAGLGEEVLGEGGVGDLEVAVDVKRDGLSGNESEGLDVSWMLLC